MDDDIYMFELFQEMLLSLEEDTTSGPMNLLSKNPRYTADDPAKPNEKQRGESLNGRETRTQIRP